MENQQRNDDLPETKHTYDRLKNDGFADFTIKQLIGQCVVAEIWEILHEKNVRFRTISP